MPNEDTDAEMANLEEHPTPRFRRGADPTPTDQPEDDVAEVEEIVEVEELEVLAGC